MADVQHQQQGAVLLIAIIILLVIALESQQAMISVLEQVRANQHFRQEQRACTLTLSALARVEAKVRKGVLPNTCLAIRSVNNDWLYTAKALPCQLSIGDSIAVYVVEQLHKQDDKIYYRCTVALRERRNIVEQSTIEAHHVGRQSWCQWVI